MEEEVRERKEVKRRAHVVRGEGANSRQTTYLLTHQVRNNRVRRTIQCEYFPFDPIHSWASLRPCLVQRKRGDKSWPVRKSDMA